MDNEKQCLYFNSGHVLNHELEKRVSHSPFIFIFIKLLKQPDELIKIEVGIGEPITDHHQGF